MSYLGFARKYRPQNFKEVTGQQHIATTLKNAIQTNRVHHAYLFCGSRGVGKTSMARIFSKALNCSDGPTTTPCDQCLNCTRIATGEGVDVLEIDGASNRGIEEIRNIKDDIKYLPSQSRYKIFIIDEVHMLTQAAFNALLKTLEEPPAHVKFVFATTEVAAIPDTILSRCQRFDFKKIGLKDVMSRLKQIADKEKIEIGEDVLAKIAQVTGGALRDSLVFLDQLASYAGNKITIEHIQEISGTSHESVRQILESIGQKNISKILEVIEDLFEKGTDPTTIVEGLIQHLRDILVIVVAADGHKFVEGPETYLNWLKTQINLFTPEFLTQAIQHLVEGKSSLQHGFMGRVVLETLLLKILRMESLLPLNKIVKQLERLESRIVNNPGFVRPQSLQQPPIAPVERPVPMPVERPVSPMLEKSLPTQPLAPTPMPPVKSTCKKEDTATSKKAAKKKSIKKNSFEECLEYFWIKLGERFAKATNLLREEAKVVLDGQELKIMVKAEYHMAVENLKKNLAIISSIAAEIFGDKTRVDFCFKGEKTNLAVLEIDKSIVENDIVVSDCLDLFGGRITRVNKIDKE